MKPQACVQARRIDARRRAMRVGLLALALVGGLWWGSAQSAEPGQASGAASACAAA